jgi:hypothetical protein
MRIVEVIDPYADEEPTVRPSLPSQPRSNVARPNQSLLALLYQALMRDGRVIAPGIIGSDFEQRHERPGNGSVNRMNGHITHSK